MELIILAAGQGKRVNKYLKKNKCLLKIKGKTLIEKIIDDFQSTIKVDKVSVVTGYKNAKIKSNLKNYNINYIYNKDYKKKEMLHSLYLGLLQARTDIIVSYSDIYFSKKIIRLIKKKKSKNIILPINSNWKQVWKNRKKLFVDDCESLKFNKDFKLTEIGNKITNIDEVMGQYMGLVFIPKGLIPNIKKFYKKKIKNSKKHITEFLNDLINKKYEIYCLPTKVKWYEFDDMQDIKNFKK